jgi:hypothetical protein
MRYTRTGLAAAIVGAAFVTGCSGVNPAAPPPPSTALTGGSLTTPPVTTGATTTSAPATTTTPTTLSPTTTAKTPTVSSSTIPRATVTVPTTVPTLGLVWASNQQGYGEVRPVTIFNGGDPTGYITDVQWSSWGSTTATGTGVAQYYDPTTQIVADSRPESANVVAFNLGTCKGKLMYQAVTWYFPQHGEHFDPNHVNYNICTGN